MTGPALLGRWGPAVAACSAYLTLVALYCALSLARNDGYFIYAQDDPYIHLSMARSLAEAGVWGISPREFASASSSPLWTLLLAVLRWAGATAVWWPFALNLLSGVALIALVQHIVRQYMPPFWQLAVLGAVVLVGPLATLAFVGMEHTLQMVLVLGFAWASARRLAGDGPDRPWPGPMALAALLVALRYEGLFVVGVVGLLCLWRRRYAAGVALGLAAAVPVALFGWYSLAHGGLVLPNSVLMKSGPGRFDSLGSAISAVLNDWVAIVGLFGRPPQLVVTLGGLVALAAAASRSGVWRPAVLMTGILVATSALHACLVKLEWFFRYEAYLIVFGLVAIAVAIAENAGPLSLAPRWRALPVPSRRALALALGLLALPLAVRALTAIAMTVPATTNVYQQQYQMGLFFREYYPGEAVALNDIGAPSWLSSSRVVDIVGLASQEVAEAKRHRRFDRAAMAALIDDHDVQAIALYEEVFLPILPESWIKVGEWQIPRNVAVSDDTVAFFAPDEPRADALRDALDEFEPRLPGGVIYTRIP